MEDLPFFYSWAVSAASSPPASQNRKKNLVTYQRNIPTSSQSNDATSRMRSVVRSSRIGQSRNRPVKPKGDFSNAGAATAWKKQQDRLGQDYKRRRHQMTEMSIRQGRSYSNKTIKRFVQ